MKLSKNIIEIKFFRFLLAKMVYYYIKLAYYTGRWALHKVDEKNINECITKPSIYAFWHGRLAMMPLLAPKNLKMNVLSSRHRDGYFIADAMRYFGFSTIFGSSKKGGVFALRNILHALKIGENIAITPDGPRGPREQINSNVIYMAKIAKVPIIPISFSARKKIIFNSWDRFMLPRLFSKGVLIYGKPIKVNNDLNINQEEELKEILQNELNYITNEADQMVMQ